MSYANPKHGHGTATCVVCGEVFNRPQYNVVYCPKSACQDEKRKRHLERVKRINRARYPKKDHLCWHCQKILDPYHPGQKTCKDPVCQDAQKKKINRWKINMQQENLQKARFHPEGVRKCRCVVPDGCRVVIDNGNRLYCSYCHKVISRRTSDLDEYTMSSGYRIGPRGGM